MKAHERYESRESYREELEYNKKQYTKLIENKEAFEAEKTELEELIKESHLRIIEIKSELEANKDCLDSLEWGN